MAQNQEQEVTHHTRRRARTAACVVASAAVVALFATPASSVEGTPLTLGGCHLTAAQFDDEAARLRQYVPKAYALAAPISIVATSGTPQAPNRASLTLWTYSCERAAVGATDTGPAVLVLVGVVIQKPDSGAPQTQPIAAYDHYLTMAASNNARLASAMRRSGLPVQHVARLSFQRSTDAWGTPSTTTTVPRPGSGLTFTATPKVEHTVHDHPHDNSFWHGADPGAAAELEIVLRGRDWFCVGDGCGVASAPAGSPMAEFLGSPQRQDPVFTADHMRIDAVAATVRRGS